MALALGVEALGLPSASADPPVTLFSRAQEVIPEGLTRLAATDAATLGVDGAALRRFRSARTGSLVLPLPDGRDLALALRRFDPLSPEVMVTYTDERGAAPLPLDITLFKGEVAGKPGSWVVVSLSPRGVLGFVELNHQRFLVGPVRGSRPQSAGSLPLHLIADERALPAPAQDFQCAVRPADVSRLQEDLAHRLRPQPATTTRLVCDIALECDYEYYADLHGSSFGQAIDYAATLLGVVSAIYERDLNVALRLSYLNLWATPADPYTKSNLVDQIQEFQTYWNANRTGQSRHLAHLLTGRPLGGGYAFLGVLCNRSDAYGVSQVLGFYNYPTPITTWDAFVLAHELGHNHNSAHTQSCFWQHAGYTPPGTLLDSCYTAEGTCYMGPTGILPRNRGTIMSYCHQLGPMNSTIRLEFHPACANEMRLHSEQCLPEGLFDPDVRLSAAVVRDSVRLSWSASPFAGVIGYDIYRGVGMLEVDPPWIGFTPTTGFIDPWRVATHYYRVRAVRASDQSGFSNEVRASPCLPTGPTCLAAGLETIAPVIHDFNEDGIMDLAIANATPSGTVTILLGQGAAGLWNGTFAPPVAYPAGIRPSDLAIGDFNEDGITDLAVTNNTTAGTFSILLGNGSGGVGNGTFRPRVSYAVELNPSAIATGDFNEDGITDLAVTNNRRNNVSVALGLGSNGVGNGTFATPVAYPVGTRPTGLVACDFDRDGILDLAAVNNGNGTVSILRGRGVAGKGDGTFAAAVSYEAGSGAQSVVSGDFNQDGIPDLALTRILTAGVVSILLGVGDGSFGAPAGFSNGALPSAVALGDVNQDGIVDVVSVNGLNNGELLLLLGRGSGGVGDGTFEQAVSYLVSSTPGGVAVGDINRDGIPDLVATHAGAENNVCVLIGSCAGVLPAEITVLSPNGGESWPRGTEQVILWSKGAGVVAVNVDLSRDDGVTWERVASGLSGTSFPWTVTDPLTGPTQARVRVSDATIPIRTDMSNAGFQVSGSAVDAPHDVALELSLSPGFPNPASRVLTVSFTLPSGAPATLELVDVSGRRVASRVVDALGAGRHVVVLGETERLAPGVYLVRLTQARRSVTSKAALLR